MSTPPTDIVKQWLEADPNWTAYGFEFQQGRWSDTPANAKKRLCFLTSTGGRTGADPGVFFDSVRVLLVGPQKGGSDMMFIRNLAYAIRTRMIEEFRQGCEAFSLRLMAAPMGPNFTTEERPWIELNIEVASS